MQYKSSNKAFAYDSIFPNMVPPMQQLDICLQKMGEKEREQLSAVLISGDMTEYGTQEDYKQLHTEIEKRFPDIPIIVTPGNHDERQTFQKVCLGWETVKDEPYCYIRRLGSVSILSMDNSYPGSADGKIGWYQCDWLKKALESEKGYHNQYTCDEEVFKHIARLSSGDIRFAYNCLEVCSIIAHENHITIEDAKNALTQANAQFDKDEDQYYDTLSGLQKSIRGSDPNGAMYYFAKLIEYNDIESLERRVLVCAYEDVGLANPNACMRTVAAFQAARTVGFPEARIPIASAIIDLCLSPKSKSSEAAIDAALASLNHQSLPAPEYLRLTPVGLDDDEKYNYDRPELWE